MSRTVIMLLTLLALSVNRYTINAQEFGAWQKISLENTKISTLETIPDGILAGELDSRLWLSPFNGIYISKDLGKTWTQLGMQGSGITDIDFYNNKIYVSTYYKKSGKSGLYISQDFGKTFYHTGNVFASSAVAVSDSTIYLGGYGHGLWRSVDNGVSWEQKIGDGSGWTGPEITGLATHKSLTMASTKTDTFISKDNGITWAEIQQFANKQISNFYISENIILAGSKTQGGMYISKDNAQTWLKVDYFDDTELGTITGYYDNNIFVSAKAKSTGNYTLFESKDGAVSWQDTKLHSPTAQGNVTSLTWVFAEPTLLFANLPADGIYKYAISQEEFELEQFLEIPWAQKETDELITRISSYFDHEYPLLGYSSFKEPKIVDTTILNFYGIREEPPDLYYSSHNGIDFKLPINTPVLAPAAGYASYYFCNGCGNSIKMDHGNGYQSIYMHLQKDSLISVNQLDKIWVETGTPIGKVGMTGNTTGPHLHFEIIQDKNQNGSFEEFPDGLTDPFSWHGNGTDPWKNFSWNDKTGLHNGNMSKYLWKHLLPSIKKYIDGITKDLVLNGVQVTFGDNEKNITATLKKYGIPHLPTSQNNFGYIMGTAITIEIFDNLKNQLTQLNDIAKISYKLSKFDLTNIIIETLTVYYWDELKRLWIPIPTELDSVNQIISGFTNHASLFALFGQKEVENIPQTNIQFSGEIKNGWFTERPTISFETSNQPLATYYSLNNGIDWQIYEFPFLLEPDGVINVLYRSEATTSDLEETKEQTLKTNSKNYWTQKINVKGAGFTL